MIFINGIFVCFHCFKIYIYVRTEVFQIHLKSLVFRFLGDLLHFVCLRWVGGGLCSFKAYVNTAAGLNYS